MDVPGRFSMLLLLLLLPLLPLLLLLLLPIWAPTGAANREVWF